MNLAGLRALLERNEQNAALGAVGRIRFAMLESQLAKARADADDARRRLFDYQLDEREEMARLRLEVRRLQAQLHALQQQAMVLAKYRPAEPINPAPVQPVQAAQARPAGFVQRKPSKPPLSAAALAIFKRDPPDPAAYDRTITEEDAA